MKTTKFYILLIGLLLAGIAQAKAPTYQNTYKPLYKQSTYGVSTTATAPSSTFQSTSAYYKQREGEENQSILNADGSVNAEVYMGNANNPAKVGPRKDPVAPPPNPGDPDEEEDEGNVPLGDVLFPLMLMAVAFIAVRIYRRRKA